VDTMFPDISIMRYRINVWRVVDNWVVTIEASDVSHFSERRLTYSFDIAGSDLKVQDLLHVVEVLHQEVASATP
jgi:hypothetical protein